MLRIFRRIAFLVFPDIRVTADFAISFNSFHYVHWQDFIPAIYYGFAVFVHVFAYEIWNSFDFQSFANCPVSKAFEISIIITIPPSLLSFL